MGAYQEAKEKLNRESNTGEYDKYAAAMKNPVKSQLIELCRQSDSFAQHIIEGGSFEECMKAVAKNVGTHISDLAAFDRAVKYYYPEAKVSYSIIIEEPTAAVKPKETDNQTQGGFEMLDLGAFL